MLTSPGSRTSLLVTILAIISLTLSPVVRAADLTFTGTVLGPDGEPVPGAIVGMAHTDLGMVRKGWTEVAADEDGRFSLTVAWEEGPWAEYCLVARSEGLAMAWTWVRADEEAEIRLGEETATCSGLIVDPGGDPVPGVDVILRSIYRDRGGSIESAYLSHDPSTPLRVTSDERGVFAIPDLPPDTTVSLRAFANGFATAGADAVPAASRPDTLTIRLSRGGRIAGRVLHRGEPVAGAAVYAGWGAAESGADGRYVIEGVVPGLHRVEVRGLQDLTAPLLSGITVEEGETTEGVDIALIPGAVVESTVTLADTGEPATGARIASMTRVSHDSVTTQSVTVKEDGIALLRVPPGEYTIYYQRNYPGYATCEPARHEMALADGAHERLSFTLQPTRVARGVVVDRAGRPVAGAEVYPMRIGHMPAFLEAPPPITSDAEGGFSMDLGAYGDQSTPAYVWSPGTDLVWVGRLQGGENEITLEPGGWLEGLLTDEGGQPVAEVGVGAHVSADGQPWRIPLLWESDEEGLVRIGPLPTERDLSVWVLSSARHMVTGEGWMNLQRRRLSAGEVQTLPALTLNPAGRTLRGTVIDAGEHPVAGATVVCNRVIEGRAAVDTTGEDGRFELNGLWASGQLGVIAVGPDRDAAWGMPCDPDFALEPVFELAPLSTVEFTVTGLPEPAPEEILVGFASRDYIPRPSGPPVAAFHFTFSEEILADADGHCRAERLVPGLEYKAYVVVNGQRGGHAGFIAQPGPEPMRVELKAPQ